MSLPTLGSNNNNKSPGLPSLGGAGLPPAGGLPNMDDIDLPNNDEFELVEIEEVLDENDEELNEDIYEEVDNVTEEQELPTMNDYEENQYANEDDYYPEYEEDIKKGKQRKFIKKKEKRVVPFGGNKSKGTIKSSDFDDRKNTLAKTKIIRAVIMFIICVLFVVGLKNTFMPAHVYTDEQIKQFAREGSGQTNFPKERGTTFVENFMEAYLTIDRTKPEVNAMLGQYYGNLNSVGANEMNMTPGTGVKQSVLVSPKVYDVNVLTDYSALFRVSAYVTNTDGTEVVDKSLTGRWLSFSVNVYYNEETDSLSITPDSPSVIPTTNIGKQSDIPKRAPFGNGEVNAEIAPAINPTINGFIQAYAEASISSHDSIKQYITDQNDIDLYNGFGGTVELNGTPETAIKRTIYNNDDGVYRVDLTINWIDAVALNGDNRVEYVGKYVMRVTPDGEGKYLVSSFVPYTYYKE